MNQGGKFFLERLFKEHGGFIFKVNIGGAGESFENLVDFIAGPPISPVQRPNAFRKDDISYKKRASDWSRVLTAGV